MKTIATDLRAKSPAFATVEVEFDESKIEQFDTRGKCESMYEETWGEKVETAIGTLYIKCFGRGDNHTTTMHNTLRD